MQPITSLYIHFPFCKHLCNYCDFYKNKLVNSDQIDDFEDLLNKQFIKHNEYLKSKGFKLSDLETLYIGGGTPSLWGKKGVDFFYRKFLNNELCLKPTAEFTLEVDPDAWSEEEIDAWLDLGVNRFSIGSQAFSDKYISLMDRTHLRSHVEKTIKFFSERKLNFSVDLMLGLPESHNRNLEQEILDLIKYNPNHFSVYILKTRSNYPLKNKLPDDGLIRKEYLLVSKLLRENSYDHYEVSNFARDGFYSKHNKKYWNYESVAGVGPNATGLLVGSKTIRYQWKSVSLGVTEEVLNTEEVLIEKILLGLRARNSFNLDEIFTREEDRKKLDRVYDNWDKLGYLRESSLREAIDLSALGYLMCDSLIDDIFKHIRF